MTHLVLDEGQREALCGASDSKPRRAPAVPYCHARFVTRLDEGRRARGLPPIVWCPSCLLEAWTAGAVL